MKAQGTPVRIRARRCLLRILRENELCAVSTVGAGGRAHVHICYFAFSATPDLFFLSDPRSRHAVNLQRNPTAAVAVFSSTQTWGGPDRGAQLFGSCAPVPSAGRKRALRVYQRRFPAFATDRAARALAIYCFSTHRATVLDERELGDAVLVDTSITRRAGGTG